MKDYYKILGLEESATGEEIHERWIELMQKYHPDHSPDGKSNEEMAMEINEAYQVLKHSGSRLEYDLQRQHQKGPKKSPAWKVIVPVAGLTIVLMIAAFLFKKPEVPVSMNQPPALPSGTMFAPREEPAKQVVAFSTPSPSEGMNETEKAKEKRGSSGALKGSDTIRPQPMEEEAKPSASVAQKKIERVPSTASVKVASGPKRSAPMESTDQKRASGQKQEKPLDPPPEISGVRPVSAPTASAKPDERSETPILPSTLATEEEVQRFFDQYVERYNKRDLQGFLALFSSKAVQNQKEGWEGIQRIYEHFFEQSRDLRYTMQNPSVEAYQNAVEVKANYRVDQISKKDGERKVWKGRIQWMLVREDGELKIISLNYRHDTAP